MPMLPVSDDGFAVTSTR